MWRNSSSLYYLTQLGYDKLRSRENKTILILKTAKLCLTVVFISSISRYKRQAFGRIVFAPQPRLGEDTN
jgi:hypothetical protein